MLALGVHRVAGDDDFCQVGDGVQQRLEASDLVRFLADIQLGQDQAGGVLQCGEQVDLAALRFGRAAQAFAVRCEAAQPVAFGRRSASQRPTARSSASPSMRANTRRTVVSAGRNRFGNSGSRRMPRRSRMCGGASAIHSLTASKEVAPARTAHAVSASTATRACRTPRGSRGSGTSASRSSRRGTSSDTASGWSRSWSRAGGISGDASASTVFHSVHGS